LLLVKEIFKKRSSLTNPTFKALKSILGIIKFLQVLIA
jgi:hypothetical protein